VALLDRPRHQAVGQAEKRQQRQIDRQRAAYVTGAAA